MGGRRQYTGFIDGESACLQVAQKGVPYLDTFYSLHLTEGNLELRNTEGDTSIASCRSTEGCANRRKYVCPKCGKIHPSDMAFCKDWGGKYHGELLRLCGIIHCIKCALNCVEPAENLVTLDTFCNAIEIGE